MKNLYAIVILGLILNASGRKEDFPSFDIFHANCAMKASYKNQPCASVYANIQKVLKEYENGDEGKGVYKVEDKQDGDYIWTTRTTPVKKYVDD